MICRSGFPVQRALRRVGSVVAAHALNATSSLAVYLMMLGLLCSGSYAQSVEAPAAKAQLSSSAAQAGKPAGASGQERDSSTLTSASSGEVERLRHEVEQLRSELSRLRSIVEEAVKSREAIASESSLARSNLMLHESKHQGTKPSAAQEEKNKPEAPQKLAPTETALTSKAKGGDLSGAGNLLRTDRITIGGYGDFQFRQSSINERADGGGTPTFQNTRLVLGIAAVLAEKQNIVFNSEIEYEFGSREIDVEQAYVEWRVRPEFAFRGGIFVPAIGRFNTFHDSYLNLTTVRPLINQFIVPTAYRDAGFGVRGRFKLPHKVKLTYEADVVNGMRSTNADGEPTPFSRLLGQSSAAEPGLFAFQAHRSSKAVVGRIGLAPINGLEIGASLYNGKFSSLGEPSQSATILFIDGSYHRGALTINGEFGRSNIVGGIPRRSPAPPLFDANDPASIAALAEFVAQRSPGQDGFYVEGTYKFSPPRGLAEKFDEGSYIAPVVRYEVARLDRTLPNFYLNRSRTTLGLNIAPSSTVIFKLNYLFNHAFGPIPNAAAAVGGALFGVSPLPYRGYGKNGFTGSIAYVF
jgi:hypothetical protein